VNRKAILLNERDDVATALAPLSKGDQVNVAVGERSVDVTLQEEVPFGHKYALRDIAAGEEVLKYGLPIGKALADIRAGAWVHVHNCRSDRFGHRHQKYGVNA
jgi:altronate dehydratase small subunit